LIPQIPPSFALFHREKDYIQPSKSTLSSNKKEYGFKCDIRTAKTKRFILVPQIPPNFSDSIGRKITYSHQITRKNVFKCDIRTAKKICYY